MEKMKLRKEVVSTDNLAYETIINISNKRYLIKRHFIGTRGLTEAINKVIINDAVRKTA